MRTCLCTSGALSDATLAELLGARRGAAPATQVLSDSPGGPVAQAGPPPQAGPLPRAESCRRSEDHLAREGRASSIERLRRSWESRSRQAPISEGDAATAASRGFGTIRRAEPAAALERPSAAALVPAEPASWQSTEQARSAGALDPPARSLEGPSGLRSSHAPLRKANEDSPDELSVGASAYPESDACGGREDSPVAPPSPGRALEREAARHREALGRSLGAPGDARARSALARLEPSGPLEREPHYPVSDAASWRPEQFFAASHRTQPPLQRPLNLPTSAAAEWQACPRQPFLSDAARGAAPGLGQRCASAPRERLGLEQVPRLPGSSACGWPGPLSRSSSFAGLGRTSSRSRLEAEARPSWARLRSANGPSEIAAAHGEASSPALIRSASDGRCSSAAWSEPHDSSQGLDDVRRRVYEAAFMAKLADLSPISRA